MQAFPETSSMQLHGCIEIDALQYEATMILSKQLTLPHASITKASLTETQAMVSTPLACTSTCEYTALEGELATNNVCTCTCDRE